MAILQPDRRLLWIEGLLQEGDQASEQSGAADDF